MRALVHGPGTYRTRSGELVHFRSDLDGSLIPELEDGRRAKLGDAIELVKLSDDPDWPDVRVRASDPELLAD